MTNHRPDRSDTRREWLAALCAAMLVLACVICADLRPWDARLHDFVFRLRGPLPTARIVLVEIDQASGDHFFARWGRYPYAPACYTGLIARLTWQARPRQLRPPAVVALDVELNAGKSVAPTRKVWLPAWYQSSDRVAHANGPPAHWAWTQAHPLPAIALPAHGIDWRLPPAALNTQPGGIAFSQPIPVEGYDGVPTAVRFQDGVYPELGFAIAAAATPSSTSSFTQARSVINYAGPLRDAAGQVLPSGKTVFRVIALAKVLAMSPSELQTTFGSADGNTIVLVGPALDSQQRNPSPYDTAGIYPVETLAHVVNMHLTHKYLTPLDQHWVWLAIMLVGLGLGVLLTRLRASVGAWCTLGLAVAWILASWLAFVTLHLLLPLLAPLATILLVYLAVITVRAAREERWRRVLQQYFASSMTPETLTQRIEQPDTAPLSPLTREVALLGIRVRDDAADEPARDPRTIIAQRGEALAEVARVIADHGGVLTSGDRFIAVFGAVTALPSATRMAISAALTLQDHLAVLNRQWVLEQRPPYRITLAVHVGQAVIGDIVTAGGRQSLALGAAADICVRLLDFADANAQSPLLTHAALTAGGGVADVRELGPIALPTHSDPLLTYCLLGQKGFYPSAVNE